MRDKVLPQFAVARAASEANDLSLAIIKLIRPTGNLRQWDAKPIGEPFPIGQQPSLDRTHGYSEAHKRRRRRQSLRDQAWSAVSIFVQVAKNQERLSGSGCIIGAHLPVEMVLSGRTAEPTRIIRTRFATCALD